jgi:hypothetical protein
VEVTIGTRTTMAFTMNLKTMMMMMMISCLLQRVLALAGKRLLRVKISQD